MLSTIWPEGVSLAAKTVGQCQELDDILTKYFLLPVACLPNARLGTKALWAAPFDLEIESRSNEKTASDKQLIPHILLISTYRIFLIHAESMSSMPYSSPLPSPSSFWAVSFP